MDFELSEEQRLLKDSLERLLADRYGFEARTRYMAEPEGFSSELWRRYAELGLLGLPFAEEYGGIGGGPVETMIAMEAFGRALALEPFFASAVLSGGLLRLAGSAEQQRALVPKLVDGSARLAFAHSEPQARYALSDVVGTAKPNGSGFVLNAEKTLVLHGDSATDLVVSARLSGERRDRGGIGLFMIPADAPGITRRGYPTQDGLRAAEISLADVRVDGEATLGTPGEALPLIERAVDAAIAALAAEAVGVMAAMHEMTVEYLKTRRQFGVPIGSFQVLQHRAVDMLIALEQARSMALFATMMAEEENADERRKAVAAAKVQIGRSVRFIGEQAVQLHGGIGMTMELKVGHYFKRATMIDMLFGDADHQLGELARLGGLTEPV